MANRELAKLVREADAKHEAEISNRGSVSRGIPATRTINDAVEQFLRSCGAIDGNGSYRGDREHGTWRKYRCTLGLLGKFCAAEQILDLDDVTLNVLEDFRDTRKIALITSKLSCKRSTPSLLIALRTNG